VSTSDKPDTARGWQFVEKLLADDDIERFDRATDEEVAQQMRAQGVQVTRVPDPEALIARVADRASNRRKADAEHAHPSVRPLPRIRLVAWLAAAAVGAMAAVLIVNTRRTPPDLSPPPQRERAADLRREAFAACEQAIWTLCEKKLDDAKGLDSNGEADPRVQEARLQIDRAWHPEAGKRALPDPK
jgi:hypothetical protein